MPTRTRCRSVSPPPAPSHASHSSFPTPRLRAAVAGRGRSLRSDGALRVRPGLARRCAPWLALVHGRRGSRTRGAVSARGCRGSSARLPGLSHAQLPELADAGARAVVVYLMHTSAVLVDGRMGLGGAAQARSSKWEMRLSSYSLSSKKNVIIGIVLVKRLYVSSTLY